MDTIEFVLWLICGLLTIMVGLLIDENHKIPMISYVCCWMALILKLINNL